jgi:hypothetical protein
MQPRPLHGSLPEAVIDARMALSQDDNQPVKYDK